MKTQVILNKEESGSCLGAYGQRKCWFLTFVQNLEGITISCFKTEAQKPNKGRDVGVRTPAGLGQLAGGLRQGGSAPSPPGGSPASPRGASAFGLLTTDRLEAPGESQPPLRTAVQNFPWLWPRVSRRELSFNQEPPPGGPRPLGGHPPLCPRQNGLGKTTPMSHPPRWGSELGNRQAERTWGHEVWAQVGGADPACSLRLCPHAGWAVAPGVRAGAGGVPTPPPHAPNPDLRGRHLQGRACPRSQITWGFLNCSLCSANQPTRPTRKNPSG